MIHYGQTVKGSRVLSRMWEGRPRYGKTRGYKVWVETNKSIVGIFLGYRNLRDGWISYDNEEGYIFSKDSSFKAALVSPGPHENPVYVPIESLETIGRSLE